MATAVFGTPTCVVTDFLVFPVTDTVTTSGTMLILPVFTQRLVPHAKLYDMMQLMDVRMFYMPTVSTARDGQIYFYVDNDPRNLPTTVAEMMVHRQHWVTAVWSPLSIRVQLPRAFYIPVRVTRGVWATADPSFTLQPYMAFSQVGVDASAPATRGHFVIQVTVRFTHPTSLHDIGEPPPWLGDNGSWDLLSNVTPEVLALLQAAEESGEAYVPEPPEAKWSWVTPAPILLAPVTPSDAVDVEESRAPPPVEAVKPPVCQPVPAESTQPAAPLPPLRVRPKVSRVVSAAEQQ